MYAVVSSGGKQYRVEPGSTLTLERLAVDAGSAVTFDRVLLVGDGEAVTVGTPTVAGATVSGTVLGEALGPKIVVFKFKQKVKYRRRTGHRQHLVRVRIDGITANGRTDSAQDAQAADKESPAPRTKRAGSAAKSNATAKPKAAAKPARAGSRAGADAPAAPGRAPRRKPSSKEAEE
jgi:large subunit ribosomal protein L21